MKSTDRKGKEGMVRNMKKNHHLAAYLLIGLGLYFLSQKVYVPIISDLATWPMLLIIVGGIFLFTAYNHRDYDKLLPGGILFFLGLHLYLERFYPYWVDERSVYFIIVGLAFLLRYQQTKQGIWASFILLGIGLFTLLSGSDTAFQYYIESFMRFIDVYWPVGLIAFGIYLLVKRK